MSDESARPIRDACDRVFGLWKQRAYDDAGALAWRILPAAADGARVAAVQLGQALADPSRISGEIVFDLFEATIKATDDLRFALFVNMGCLQMLRLRTDPARSKEAPPSIATVNAAALFRLADAEIEVRSEEAAKALYYERSAAICRMLQGCAAKVHETWHAHTTAQSRDFSALGRLCEVAAEDTYQWAITLRVAHRVFTPAMLRRSIGS